MPRQHLSAMHFPGRILFVLVALALHAMAAVNDDIFTGPPLERRQPPARPEPTGTEWDRMLDEAGATPLALPATTVTEGHARQQRSDWWHRHAFDPQLALVKGKPDEKDVRAFLDEFGPAFLKIGVPVANERGTKICLAIANGTERRPAVDFLAGDFLFTHGRKADAVKLLRTVADAPTDAPLPLLARVLAQAHVLNHSSTRDKADPAVVQRYFQLFTEHLGVPCSDEEADMFIFYHINPPIFEAFSNREDRHAELYKNSKFPDWARFTMGGTLESSRAFRESRQDMNWVTGKSPRSMKDRNARANELFLEAWRLRPTARWAAKQLIMSRGVERGEDDTPRIWVERALAACCDYERAVEIFLRECHEHGSYEDIISFGRACAETKRYDCELPTFLNQALATIAGDLEDWRPMYRQSKLAPLLLETREKCLQAATTESNKYLHNSFLFYEAWACGDYARASKALAQLPRDPVSGPFAHEKASKFANTLSQDAVFPMGDTALRAGPGRAPYEKGLAAIEAGRFAEARTHFKAALESADETGQKLLAAEIALADFQERYATGEWSKIPLQERLCWNFAEGTMTWRAEQKRARLHNDSLFTKILFRGALGDSFAVRGHFVPTRAENDRNGGGFAAYCGHSPDSCGRSTAMWWSARVDTRNTTQMTMDFKRGYGANSKLQQAIPWSEDSTFVFRREKGRITFQVAGKELHSEIPDDEPGGSGAFGLGQISWPGVGICDIWNVEARNLRIARRNGSDLAADKPEEKKNPAPAAPAGAAAPADQAKMAADAAAAIVGVWRFSWEENGWNALRNFKADGTFTAEASKGAGKWVIEGDKLILTYPDRSKDEMFLPLNPNGTKVIGKNQRVLTAVRRRP